MARVRGWRQGPGPVRTGWRGPHKIAHRDQLHVFKMMWKAGGKYE
jgi:hypothetical protein